MLSNCRKNMSGLTVSSSHSLKPSERSGVRVSMKRLHEHDQTGFWSSLIFGAGRIALR